MKSISGALVLTCLTSICAQAAAGTIPDVPAGKGVSNTLISSGQILFPLTPVGFSTPAQNVIASAGVSNASNVIITSCAISGFAASDFSQTPAITTPLAVAPGATVLIPVVFTPSMVGVRNAMLTCNLTDGPGSNFVTMLDGTAAPPEPVLVPNPPNGTMLNASGPAGTPLSRVVSFANVSNASSTVSCTATGAGFNVTGSPLSVAAGAQGSMSVTGTSATLATLTGALDCTSNDDGPFLFPLRFVFGSPAITQIPLIGDLGRWALLGLFAGVGMIFAVRKRG
jgi:hypothetical protein